MSPPQVDFDCGRTCKSRQHGAWCVAAVIRGTDDEILAAVQTKCQNFFGVWDSGGKNVLHAAASCGKRKIVEWFVRGARARINAKDLESGYTALHRSLFYGQLNCAVELIRLGCNVGSLDHEGLTAFEIALLDRPGIVDLNPSNPCEIYAWGTNSNYNLGVGHDQTRTFPEISEYFRQNGIIIRKVSMDKFHTLLVDAHGAVYSCGHGTGGRLGHGTDRPQLEPKLIQMPVESAVVQAVAAANHSVFLLENSLVLACGSNQLGQLGQPQQTSQLDTPKVLPWFKTNKSGQSTYDTTRGICGLTTSRFHTAFFCRKAVYSFGLNGGQLGHGKVEKEKVIWTPKKVTTLDLTQDGDITGIAASEGSTVVTVKRDATGFSDVYALHEYQCRKVASKLAGDLKVSVVGGNLDAKVAESSGLIEHGGSDLRIMILAAGDRLLLWRGAHNHLTRIVLNAPQRLTVGDALLTKTGVVMVTRSGQAYVGHMSDKPTSAKSHGLEPSTFRSSYTRVIGGKVGVGAVDDKIYQFPPEIVKVERVPGIWRAVAISADPKGRNFMALQANPKDALFELPEIDPSTMSRDMRSFYDEIGLNDKIHDVELRIDGKEYPAHWFILRSRCPFFNKLYLSADWSAMAPSESAANNHHEPAANDGSFSMFGYSSPFANGSGDFDPLAFEAEMEGKMDQRAVPVVDIDVLRGVPPKIIEQLLLFVYSGTCDLTNEGGCPFKIPATADKNSKFVVRPVKANVKSEPRGKKKGKQKKAKTDVVEEVVDSSPVLDPVAVLADVAEKLGWKPLRSAIACFEFNPPSVAFPFGLISRRPGYRPPASPVRFFRQDYPELQDLVIVAEDGVELSGHQCILAARLQYFRSLLGISGSGWFESSRNRVTMPLPADLLEIVVDFLYSDSTPDGVALARDPGIPANVLVVADQLLIDRLKNMCEETLVNHLTLKNVAELLDFSDTYNARQLKNACFQFVSLNVSAIMESRALESIGELKILDELAEYYRNFVLQGGKRRLTPYFSVGPSAEELQSSSATFGVKIDDILNAIALNGDNGEIHAADSSEALKIKVSGSKTPSKKRAPPRVRRESQTTNNLDKHQEEEPNFSATVASPSPKPKMVQPEATLAAKKKIDEAEKVVAKKGVRIMPAPVTPQKFAEREAAMAAQTTPVSSSPAFTTFRLAKPASANGTSPTQNNIEAFPSLGTNVLARRNSGLAAEAASPTSPSSSSSSSTPARPRTVESIPVVVKTKLSQKQRKKLASGGPDEEQRVSPPPSPPRQAEAEVVVTPTKPINAWANPLPGTSKPPSSPSELTSKLANMSFEELPALSGQRRKSTRKSEPSEDSFTQILQEEMERRENLERIKMKPLSKIQEEDQAIEELLRFYNADGNAEERITVIRCGPSDFAAPVWHKKSSAGGGAQRLH